jgi:acetyl-CoA carboxylase biotin carboxylase subunit
MNLRPFKRVLVANRGEIAVRVIRGAHELGLETVAVFSDADERSLHVRVAGSAWRIGPPPSSESYLRADRLLEVAERAGCDAVHPGYGFLSENAEFAQAVMDAGLVWVGPPPDAIASMGSKTAARTAMHQAGVPVVPGTLRALTSDDEALRVAREIGLPIMLKASAGGGGKGMRMVEREEDLAGALAAARSEAKKAFGDDAVYVEKVIVQPRHVEIQVLADGHGNVIHLFERDCSIQRRHQKVFEETPSPALDEATRRAMTEAAVRAAQAVGYVSAGTVEFLLGADMQFHFLEMNTRLQVEHAITEEITGIDLVHAQLRVAAGERLWMTQDGVHPRGHAVECRIYAEDALAGFRPSPGPLLGYREPGGPGIRVDSGVIEGVEVPVHYDPMVAKLIAWAPDRDLCLDRARSALRDYRVVGIPTSIPFFLALLEDPDFRRGDYHTGFIRKAWLEEHLAAPDDREELAAILAAVARYERDIAHRAPDNGSNGVSSAWKWGPRWKTLFLGGQ